MSYDAGRQFRDFMRGIEKVAAEPPPKIQANEGCRAPGCNCGRPPAIVVFPMRIESLVELEAVMLALRAAADQIWGPEP